MGSPELSSISRREALKSLGKPTPDGHLPIHRDPRSTRRTALQSVAGLFATAAALVSSRESASAAPRREDPPPRVVPEPPSPEAGVAGIKHTAPEYTREFTPAEMKIKESLLVNTQTVEIQGKIYTFESRTGENAITVMGIPTNPSDKFKEYIEQSGFTNFVFVTLSSQDKSIKEIPTQGGIDYGENGKYYPLGTYAVFVNGVEMTFIHRMQPEGLDINNQSDLRVLQLGSGTAFNDALIQQGLSLYEWTAKRTLEQNLEIEARKPYAQEMIVEAPIKSSK